MKVLQYKNQLLRERNSSHGIYSHNEQKKSSTEVKCIPLT